MRTTIAINIVNRMFDDQGSLFSGAYKASIASKQAFIYNKGLL